VLVNVSADASVSRSNPREGGFLTHGEIAAIFICAAAAVAGMVYCFRKRFSWLQSARIKLGETYSMQINYADDVGMDVLPTLASGGNGPPGAGSVEETSADVDRSRTFRRKHCPTSALSGLTRLKSKYVTQQAFTELSSIHFSSIWRIYFMSFLSDILNLPRIFIRHSIFFHEL